MGEAQPWAPMTTDRERANLVLLTAIGSAFHLCLDLIKNINMPYIL